MLIGFWNAEAIAFLVATYKSIGDSARRGLLRGASLAKYKQFQRVLQVYWPLILNEVRPSRATNRPLDLVRVLRTFRTQWERLSYLVEEVPTGHVWNEREMLGCFNVECLCYGLKPLHKLRGCKRCQTARYCNKECQRK